MAEHKEWDSLSSDGAVAHRAVIASVVFVAVVFLALFLWYSIQVLLLIFAGVLIAILLRGLSDWVSEWTGLGHGASLAIVLVVLIGSLGSFFWLAAPKLTHEIGQRRLDVGRGYARTGTAARRGHHHHHGPGRPPSGY